MKKLFTLLFFAFTAIAASAQHPVLVTAQWLNEHKSDPNLVVLQVSFMKYEYDQTHIPGAQFLWPESLAPNSPYGSYNAPDIKKATEVVRGFGINNDSHIVIYYVRNELPAAARMFLTLEHFGLGGKVSMLNGGMDAWKKDGFATNAEVPAVKKGNVKLTAGNLLVDKEYVLKKLGLTEDMFDAIMRLPVNSHWDFDTEGSFFNYYPMLKPLRPIWEVYKSIRKKGDEQ